MRKNERDNKIGLKTLVERIDLMKYMNDLRSEHNAILHEAQPHMEALLDVLNVIIQKFGERR